jgi:tRNA threonylcarbamoyladenosine biosynthesis protein TsaB
LALLLNIDTATEVASVAVSLNGDSLAFAENHQQREHASFIHIAVDQVLKEAGLALTEIDAFGVTSGPGSYTGLRVGMATAKGFCYAFGKPLVTINTLEVMAQAGLEAMKPTENTLLGPMIDARRMEVFTALYDRNLKTVLPPQAMILDQESFNNQLAEKKILFFGSGSAKFKAIKVSENAIFEEVQHTAKNLARLANEAFQKKIFADVSYSEPNYFKEFYSTQKG